MIGKTTHSPDEYVSEGVESANRLFPSSISKCDGVCYQARFATSGQFRNRLGCELGLSIYTYIYLFMICVKYVIKCVPMKGCYLLALELFLMFHVSLACTQSTPSKLFLYVVCSLYFSFPFAFLLVIVSTTFRVSNRTFCWEGETFIQWNYNNYTNHTQRNLNSTISVFRAWPRQKDHIAINHKLPLSSCD